jgi:hypothetical protein
MFSLVMLTIINLRATVLIVGMLIVIMLNVVC